MFYNRAGTGSTMGQSKAALFHTEVQRDGFNVGALKTANRHELPAYHAPSDTPPLYKVTDFMLGRRAEGYLSKRPPPGAYNKGELRGESGLTLAPLEKATHQDIEHAFAQHFKVSDPEEDELHVPNVLIAHIKRLDQQGYKQAFINNFISNLQFKSLSRLTAKQAGLYQQIMGDVQHPRHAEFNEKEMDLIRRGATGAGWTLTKFQAFIVQEIREKSRSRVFQRCWHTSTYAIQTFKKNVAIQTFNVARVSDVIHSS
jgi:hypothetical protein